MGFNNAAMVIAADAIKAQVTHAQLHSGDPGGAGTSNTTAAARQPISWSTTTGDGDFALGAVLAFDGLTPLQSVTYLSFWSSLTSGTYYGSVVLSGELTANSEGNFRVTTLSVDGNSA